MDQSTTVYRGFIGVRKSWLHELRSVHSEAAIERAFDLEYSWRRGGKPCPSQYPIPFAPLTDEPLIELLLDFQVVIQRAKHIAISSLSELQDHVDYLGGPEAVGEYVSATR